MHRFSYDKRIVGEYGRLLSGRPRNPLDTLRTLRTEEFTQIYRCRGKINGKILAGLFILLRLLKVKSKILHEKLSAKTYLSSAKTLLCLLALCK